MTEQTNQPEQPADLGGTERSDRYAVVEVFGHRSHAGRVSEVTVAGVAMLRIVTPFIAATPATERRDVQTRWTYDYSRGGNVSYEEPGRYVREASPEIASEELLYGGAAIFSVRYCTEQQAYAHHYGQSSMPREDWVPDEPRGAVRALPAPDDDPWATDDPDNNEEDNPDGI